MDRGLGVFDGIGGEFGTPGKHDWLSHAWLEQNGLIVDITADQCPWVSERVIVTRDDQWHRRFHVNNRGVADVRRYGPAAGAQLGAVYDRILALL